MRCTRLAVAIIGLTLIGAPAAWASQAAAPATTPATQSTSTAKTKAPNAQQQKMAACNKDATAKHLTGAERKTFMSTCLSTGSEESSGKKLTAQQEKMKTCNAEATSKKLKGTERKTFMSSCLKGS